MATIRFAELLILFFYAKSALSQERVEVREGQDILLPCHYEKKDRPVTPDVFWRDKLEAHLYDIIAGKADLGSQDRRFHNRTESFPENYGRGNYSVLLRRATPGDSGLYTCYLPSLRIQQVVELQVTIAMAVAAGAMLLCFDLTSHYFLSWAQPYSSTPSPPCIISSAT
ncbi:hypothetical protein CRUP_032764, partial [Coryphaenoides rupestris]